MNHFLLARVALTSLCALQGLATVSIDFNRTHATNPSWPGHARFHVVWQSTTVVLLSVVELLLIWRTGPFQSEAFYLASLLAALSPMGFLATFALRRVFRGTLSDPNGMPSVRLTIFGVAHSVDMNLIAVMAALIALVAIDTLYVSA